jgi:hypothetical protein
MSRLIKSCPIIREPAISPVLYLSLFDLDIFSPSSTRSSMYNLSSYVKLEGLVNSRSYDSFLTHLCESQRSCDASLELCKFCCSRILEARKSFQPWN